MIRDRVFVMATVAVTTAYAQSLTAQTLSTTTTTVYEDCASVMPSMITITEGSTVTYCPECEMSSTAYPVPPGYTTVYTTTYMSLCPTGLIPATYTVTESCTEATPTWTPGPSHIPNGFTTTETTCTVCDTTPMAVTITEPCGCEASNGVPVSNGNAAPTPTAPLMPLPHAPGSGAPGSGTPGSAVPGSGVPGSGVPAPAPCNGEECGGNANQSPTGASSGIPPASPPSAGPAGSPACNGEECGGSGSQSPPNGASPASPANVGGLQPQSISAAQAPPYPTTGFATVAAGSSTGTGNSSGTTSVTPSAGGASSLAHTGIVTSAILAIVIGFLALAL